MKFPYIKTPSADSRKKWISRPIIPVTLFGPKGSIIVDALLDSRADKCLFNDALAEEIGLDLKKGEKEIFSGIEGGQTVAFLHKIQLQIVGVEEKIEITAGFAKTPGIFTILGQKDHETIEITPIKRK